MDITKFIDEFKAKEHPSGLYHVFVLRDFNSIRGCYIINSEESLKKKYRKITKLELFCILNV